MSEWFAKLPSVHWYTWLIIMILMSVFFALTTSGQKTNWNSRRIAYAAMSIAIAFILSYVRIWRMPQGGSVTLVSSLPIIAFAVAAGPWQGLVVGFAYGMLQLIQDLFVVHPLQVLLDYPLAYGALALGAFALLIPMPKYWQLPAAILIGSIGRYAMSVLSGVVFFSSYAEGSGHTPLVYSLIYNSVILVDGAICIGVALIPGMSRIVNILRHSQDR